MEISAIPIMNYLPSRLYLKSSMCMHRLFNYPHWTQTHYFSCAFCTRPTYNLHPVFWTCRRPATTVLALVRLNTGSSYVKTDALTDIARDIFKEVPKLLMMQPAPQFTNHPSRPIYIESHLQTQHFYSPPHIPFILYIKPIICQCLFNSELNPRL